MLRLCTSAERIKLLREIQAGNLEVLVKFHRDYPETHWSDSLRYEKTGDTILHVVSRLGLCEVIEYLLVKYQPNAVDCRNNDDKTALHEAAQFARHEAVRLLLKSGAEVNAIKKSDWTPLMLACTKPDGVNSFRTVEVLLEGGANVNYHNKDGWTALHLTAREGDSSILRLLLTYGLDVSKTSKNGRTALHVAALHGNHDIIRNLNVLDVNQRDSCGNTAFHEAVLGANVKLCDFLLSKGADANARNNSDYGALHLAASRGDVAVIEYLIETLRFHVNDGTRFGLTPLHCAARNRRREAYDLLVRRGADELIKDSFGRTPLDYKSI